MRTLVFAVIAAMAMSSLPPFAGRAAAAESIAVSPTSHDFGVVAVGQSSTALFSVLNNGTTRLVISASASAPFSAGDSCPSGDAGGLAPGQTCNVTGKFIPTTTGAFSSTLWVLYRTVGNDVINPRGVPVRGRTPMPDLVVSSFSAPSTFQSGATVNYTWTITNQGDATAAGWSDQVWLSTSSTSITGAVAAGGIVAKSSLAPDESYTQTFSATVPCTTCPSLAPGPYFFILQTDSGSQVTEMDETNNRSAQATNVALVVNTTDDNDDGACNATHCSLREAINAANADAGPELIAFGIAGPGPHVITPASLLPQITGTVTIDGQTQPGFFGDGPVVTIDGSLAGASADGLRVSAAGSRITGLRITKFTGRAVLIANALGPPATGITNNALVGNGNGLELFNVKEAFVVGNVISGNSCWGVYLGSTRTVSLSNNKIGVLVDGTTAARNGCSGVILINNGGATASQNNALVGNVIAHNGSEGVQITNGSSNNVLFNNTIRKNDTVGVLVVGETTNGNQIEAGSITGHVGPAIDLRSFANGGIAPPGITDVLLGGSSGLTVSGTALPGALVSLYVDPADEAETFLGETFAGSNGAWTKGSGWSIADLSAITASLKSGALKLHATQRDSAGNTSELSLAPAADVTAPAWPGGAGLTTTTLGPKLIEFTWPAASDNAGVASYKVFRDGVLRGTTTGPSITAYRAGGLASGTTYTFEVQACDAAGNCTALAPQTISTPIGLNNYTWSMAYPLTPGTPVQEHLFQVGLSAWFKFQVRPDQEVTVDLTGLPEDYDLLLFKDIARSNDPVTNLKELQVHSARLLDSALIDSALIDSSLIDSALIDSSLIDSSLIDSALIDSSLIDSALIDSALIDSALIDSALIDSSLIDSALIDSALIDSALIDSALIDSSLIDSALIDSSLIDSALIDSALIDSALIDSALIDSASSAAARASFLTRSSNHGTVSEQIRRLTFTATGDYYIRVRGKGGRFSTAAPFTVNVSVTPGACETIAPIVVAPGATLLTGTAGGYSTLVLVDLARMAGTAQEKQALLAAIEAYLARPEVNGVLVHVDQDARVAAANAQADGSPGCAFGKNLVAAEIKRIIDSWRFNADGTSRNPIDEIVIVGPDSTIPLWREVSPPYGGETGYEPPALHASPTDSALKSNFYLSQDRYGSSQEIEYVGDGVVYLLPIQEVGVSRVLETAAEAAAQFQGYVGLTGGQVPSTTSALVTGYDFLKDFAEDVRADLTAGMPAGSTVNSLISDVWTTQQLKDLILQQRYDLLSIGGHFTAFSTIGPDYNPATKLRSTEVRDSAVDMRWAVAASPGCHCGFNVPDADAVPGVTAEPDWAQVAARKGFILVCGTGYQYGDTDLVEYSERLYREFWRQLRAGTPVSTAQALLAAKTAYRQKPITADIHIKALLEVMHVGLPVRVTLAAPAGTPPGAGGSVTDTDYLSGPGATLGLSRADLHFGSADLGLSAPITVPVDLASGGTATATYLTGADGFLVSPLEPVLPLVLESVASNGTVLRGIGFRGGTYTDTLAAAGQVALVSMPGTEQGSPMVPLISDVFYPIRFWGVTYPAGPERAEVTLFLTPQQLRSTDPSGGSFIRRAFGSADFRSFYSTHTGAAATAGAFAIEQVNGTVAGSTVTFSVTVYGDPRVGAQEVWITYAAGDGQWRSVDLTRSSSGPVPGREVWTGTLTLAQGADPADLRFMAQVANGLGIVSLATNGGEYFGLGVQGAPAPTPAATQLSLQAPAATVSAPFGSQLSLSAVLTSAGQPVVGALVTFYLGGQPARATTDANGVAAATLPLSRTPGTYDLYARFSGLDLFDPAQSGSVAVTVQKDATAITLSPQPAGLSGQYSDAASPTIVATLRAAQTGAALREETIYWVVTGSDASGTARYYATTDITNADGRAVLQIAAIPLPEGVYTVTAHFGGSIPQAGGSVITLSHSFYQSSTATSSLTVAAEDSAVAYTGSLAVATGAAVPLAASVTPAADGSAGEVANAVVRYVVRSGATVVADVTAAYGTGAWAAVVPAGVLGTGVYTLDVTVVGGFYTSPTVSYQLSVGRIAFTSTRDGNSEIYLMNADGTGVTRLTTHAAVDADPAISPDGTKISFTSTRDGSSDIYLMNIDGTGVTRLTFGSGASGLGGWSPDGKKIAFTARVDRNTDVYVMNADGTGLVRLTTDPAVDADPAFSPDGSRIVFTSGRDGNAEIYTMNADGTGLVRLTAHSAFDAAGGWSSTGKIVFTSTRDGNSEIYTMSADGTGLARLTTHSAVDATPGWSADGTKIVFSTTRDGNAEIYVMNADGSGLIRLTSTGVFVLDTLPAMW